MAKRLVKSTDRKLFGVAGGLAEYFDIDATLIRVGLVVLSFCLFPLALVAYLALAVMMPSLSTAPPGPASGQTCESAAENFDDGEAARGRGNLLGWALVGLGALIALFKISVFSLDNWWLIVAVLIGVGVVLLTRRSRTT